jgi:hypothetical protein
MTEEVLKNEAVVGTEIPGEKKPTSEVKQAGGEGVEGEVKELTEVEKRAAEQGWRPLAEWDGDAADWRDARQFLDRGELLNRISAQSKEMKELRKTLRAFEDLNKKLADTKFNEKLQELKVAKAEALESGDAKRVVEIDDQIDVTKDAMAANKATAIVSDAPAEQNPEFQRWVDKNSWYAQNEEMRMFADNVGTSFARMNRDKTPQEVLKYVENRVKRAYRDMFMNERREEPSKVEGGSTRGNGKPSTSYSLTAEEEQVMNTLVKGGHMTKDEYIKQLKLLK